MGLMDGKTLLVNGGGKAKTIGYGIARAFAQAGADVALVGHSSSKLNAAHELESYGVRVATYRLEDAKGAGQDAVRGIVQQAAREFGRIDVLVNCLQSAKVGAGLAQLVVPDLEAAIADNAVYYFKWMTACYPYLQRQGGCVINFVSNAALSGNKGFAALAAASHAIAGLTCTAAAEWADDGIAVHAVSARAQTAQLDSWAQEFPEELAGLAAQLDVSILNSVDEVGAACVKLACEGPRQGEAPVQIIPSH